jgi:hypothetical protein
MPSGTDAGHHHDPVVLPPRDQLLLGGQGERGDPDAVLDQQVGGHAIVRTHAAQPQLGPYADPARLYAVDVFRPPLAAGAVGVPYSERRLGEELLVRGTVERDIDRARLGDQTQDVGDLRLVNAHIARRAGRKVLIAARIRNVGSTVRQMPFLLARRAPRGGRSRDRPDRLPPEV